MDELIKYESVDELKADLTPMEQDPAKSKESHTRFERFARLVRETKFYDESPASNNASIDSNGVYGV